MSNEFEHHVALIRKQEGVFDEAKARFIAWAEGPRGLRRRRNLCDNLARPIGTFAVVAERKDEGPLLMETTGALSSYDAAGERAEEWRQRADVVRTCVVRLSFEAGNELLLQDMERMQQ